MVFDPLFLLQRMRPKLESLRLLSRQFNESSLCRTLFGTTFGRFSLSPPPGTKPSNSIEFQTMKKVGFPALPRTHPLAATLPLTAKRTPFPAMGSRLSSEEPARKSRVHVEKRKVARPLFCYGCATPEVFFENKNSN